MAAAPLRWLSPRGIERAHERALWLSRGSTCGEHHPTLLRTSCHLPSLLAHNQDLASSARTSTMTLENTHRPHAVPPGQVVPAFFCALRGGFSAVVTGIERRDPGVRAVCSDLSMAVGGSVHANCYLTPRPAVEPEAAAAGSVVSSRPSSSPKQPTQSAFGWHIDPWGVVVRQVAGSKTWFVGPRHHGGNRQEAMRGELVAMLAEQTGSVPPLISGSADGEGEEVGKKEKIGAGKEVVTLTLKEGDWLYLPSYTLHCCEPVAGEGSFHVTFGLEGPQLFGPHTLLSDLFFASQIGVGEANPAPEGHLLRDYLVRACGAPPELRPLANSGRGRIAAASKALLRRDSDALSSESGLSRVVRGAPSNAAIREHALTDAMVGQLEAYLNPALEVEQKVPLFFDLKAARKASGQAEPADAKPQEAGQPGNMATLSSIARALRDSLRREEGRDQLAQALGARKRELTEALLTRTDSASDMLWLAANGGGATEVLEKVAATREARDLVGHDPPYLSDDHILHVGGQRVRLGEENAQQVARELQEGKLSHSTLEALAGHCGVMASQSGWQ